MGGLRMSECTDVLGMLQEFEKQVRAFDALGPEEHKITEVKVAEDWAWSEGIGVYYFRNASGVLYVGRALPGTRFGNRIWSHLQPGDEEWDAALVEDGSAFLGLIPMPEDQWYLAAALELYLIDSLGIPPFNKKRG